MVLLYKNTHNDGYLKRGTVLKKIACFMMMIKYLMVLPCLFLCFTNLQGQNLITDSGLSTYPAAPWSSGSGTPDCNDPSLAGNDPRTTGGCDDWINFDGIAGNNASQDGGKSIGATHGGAIDYDFPALVDGACYTIFYEYANPGLDDCGTIINGDGFWRFNLGGGGWVSGPTVSVGTEGGTMEWYKASVTVTAGASLNLRIQARRVTAGDNPYLQIDNVVMVEECSGDDLGDADLNLCYGVTPACYPLCTADATVQPGVLYNNPASCDIDSGDPTDVIEIPDFDCGDAPTPVTFETTILPNNPTILYHYWGNCAPLSPAMPEKIEPTTNGYIQQMFCETDAFGLPAFPGGLSGENGFINILPQSTLDVGCNGFAEVGTCECGVASQVEKTTELIQLDFWLAVPNIQSQIGFRFGGGQCDAGSFFVGSDLNNMCEVAYYTDGMVHIDAGVTQQETGTFNIADGQLTKTCGLSWLRVRIYINDLADQFTVTPEINVGNDWVTADELLIEPALSADDNMVPTVETTPVFGYIIEEAGEQFLYDANGTWDPYGCNPVVKPEDIGVCGSMCPAVNPIDVMDAVCDGMLGATITDWMTSVEANAANMAAIADANTDAAVIYSMDANPSEAMPPMPGTADASNAMMSCDNDTETTYAYLLCHGMDGDAGGGDDFYLLVGTHVLTVYAPAEQPTDGIVACVNTPVAVCMDGTDDVFSAVATNPMGGAAIANWDGTSYTSQSGDAAGTVDIVVTTANGCTATFTITTPACTGTVMCPTITAEDDTDAVCDGALMTEISTWQSDVEMTSSAAIADDITAATVEYSSAIVDGVGVLTPNGTVANGTWTGPGCANEIQTTYAYLLCYGIDDTEGTADDMYLLIGTHVLTIYAPAQDPTDGIVDCVNTPVAVCIGNVFSTVATNPMGGAAIANWDGTKYTAQSGDLAGTVEIVVTTADGCTETFTIETPACPAMCPATTAEDDADAICDGTLNTEVSSWQTTVGTTNAAAIGDANTAATVEYSSTLVDGVAVLIPNGTVANGTWTGPGCANETQTTYAYLLCYGIDATEGTADDMYLLIGTHVLTIYAPAQDPTDGIVDCVNTPVDACTDDTYSTTATNPTGGADIANWDGTKYTAQSGDLVGTVKIIVTTTNGCTETFTIETPACPAMCPATTAEDDADAICDGTLNTEVSSWQTTVGTTNAAAIGDANTAATVEYSSTLVDGVAVLTPNGTVANGTWTGPGCANETQTTYAYLLCYGIDATEGTADDMYLLIGTHVLTIYAPAQDPTDAIVDCVNTPVAVCIGNVFSTVATNPMGGAAIANWDGTKYTAQSGDLAGTVEIIVTTTNGCTETFTIETPACSTFDIFLEDPCNCENLANIILSDGTFLFIDTLTIDVSEYSAPYPTITVTPLDNNAFDIAGNQLSVPTTSVIDLGGGIFGYVFYTKSGVATAFSATVDGVTKTKATASCTPCLTPIPTMSQWGLMIYGLLILNLFIGFLNRKKLLIG